MANNISSGGFTGVATAAISAHRFVMIASGSTDADLNVTAAAAGTSPIIGIATAVNPSSVTATYNTAAAAGDSVQIARIGDIVYLEVNGNSTAIAVGDPLTATTAGVGVKSTTANDVVGAVALQAATTDGVLIPVLVTRYENYVA